MIDFKEYVGNKFIFHGENVGVALKNRKTSDEYLVQIIFDSWINSTKHNKLILNPDIKYGACSVVVFLKKFYITYKDKRVLAHMKKCLSTLNLYH